MSVLIARKGISWSLNNPFLIVRKYLFISIMGGASLHSHQQGIRIPLSTHPHQHFLSIFFLKNYSSGARELA